MQKLTSKLMVIMFAMFLVQNVALKIDASTARMQGMGIDLYPWIIEKNTVYSFSNPALVSDYSNHIYFDYDMSGIYSPNSGGLIIDPIDNLTVGFFSGYNVKGNWNNLYTTSGYTSSTGYAPSNTLSNLSEKNFSALFGYKMNAMRFGLGLQYANAGDEDTAETDTLTAPAKTVTSYQNSEFGIDLGYSMDMGQGLLKSLDVKANLTFLGIEDSNEYNDDTSSSKVSYEDDGAKVLEFNARLTLAPNQKNLVHVFASYMHENNSTKTSASSSATGFSYTAEDTYERKSSSFFLGIADEYKFHKDYFVFIGAGLSLTNATWKYDGQSDTDGTVTYNPAPLDYTGKDFKIPVFMGMEAAFLENWQARFGFSHNILNKVTYPDGQVVQDVDPTDDSVTEEDKYTYIYKPVADNTFSMGLSYVNGNFRIDWFGNIEIFRSGPNFISGASNNFSTAVAATYYFGEIIEKVKN